MQTKEIKAKIKSVSNIEKITRTMEMVSVSKMRRSTSRALASQVYARYALEMLVHITKEREAKHIFLSPGKGGKTLVVIIGSNKGLCGGYNVNISKKVSLFVKENPSNFSAVTIGKQAEKIARRNSIEIIASFTELGDLVTTEEVNSVVEVVIEQFQSSDYKNVFVAFTNYVKMLEYKPSLRQILPITEESLTDITEVLLEERKEDIEKENLSLYSFEPNTQEVLNEIIPNLLTSFIYQTLLEASASEHSSRMVAMKGATDNAGSMLEDLRLSFNKARQEAITREISEIAAGGEATSS